MMHEREESEGVVAPGKPSNEAERSAAETVEGRTPAKGNPPERLRQAYLALKRDAAAGIDGETWRHYGERLEENLRDLSERLRGAYRARPARRAFIPKADGRLRPLGGLVLEDRLVQRATAEMPNALYETDFLGFSYGFRPGRSAHDALDALAVGIETRRVRWVLDADIRSFFDAMKHEWIVNFPIPGQGAYLRAVVTRHARYFGVRGNGAALQRFRYLLGRLWVRTLRRRGQRRIATWERLRPHLDRRLPIPHVRHPWPSERLAVRTRGKSRMR